MPNVEFANYCKKVNMPGCFRAQAEDIWKEAIASINKQVVEPKLIEPKLSVNRAPVAEAEAAKPQNSSVDGRISSSDHTKKKSKINYIKI